MLCRWVARFMELHSLPTATVTGVSAAANGHDAVSGTAGQTGDEAPLVSPEELGRAIADATATHREHALPSCSLTFPLQPGLSSDTVDRLIQLIRRHLRSTDLLAVHPAYSGKPDSSSGTTTGANHSHLEILLTFSDTTEAALIGGSMAQAISGDPELQSAIAADDIPVTQLGSPALS
jgi:hypothetical protein